MWYQGGKKTLKLGKIARAMYKATDHVEDRSSYLSDYKSIVIYSKWKKITCAEHQLLMQK